MNNISISNFLDKLRKLRPFICEGGIDIRAIPYLKLFFTKSGNIILLKRGGDVAYSTFIETMLNYFTEWEKVELRSVLNKTFVEYAEEILKLPQNINSISLDDASALINFIAKKISAKQTDANYLIPVILSPRPYKTFNIGPVTFKFIKNKDDIINFALTNVDKEIASTSAEKYIEFLWNHKVQSLACINIKNLPTEEGHRVATLITDLACTAIQLLFFGNPHLEKIGTLDNSRGRFSKQQLIVHKNYRLTLGSSISQPLLHFSLNYFDFQLEQQLNKPIVKAIGSIVTSLLSKNWRCRTLEQAWCDAAHWYQDALGSLSHGAALAKYEASLENLVFAHSQTRAKNRLKDLSEVLFSFKRNEIFNEETQQTLSQVIDEIMSDRSRMLHGDSSTISKDWQNKREQAARITNDLLKEMSLKINLYARTEGAQENDDWNSFLKWLKAEKSQNTDV